MSRLTMPSLPEVDMDDDSGVARKKARVRRADDKLMNIIQSAPGTPAIPPPPPPDDDDDSYFQFEEPDPIQSEAQKRQQEMKRAAELKEQERARKEQEMMKQKEYIPAPPTVASDVPPPPPAGQWRTMSGRSLAGKKWSRASTRFRSGERGVLSK